MGKIFAKKFDVQGRFTRQRGASLLEGIAYLGIAAVVILGAVSLLGGAFGNAQANRAIEEVNALRTNARKLFAGQTYPAGAVANGMLDIMRRANAIPGTLPNNGANFSQLNAWGGAVTVVGGGGTFTVQYNAVPRAECIAMISGATGWTAIAAGAAGNQAAAAIPATAAQADAACNADTNIINFTAT